MAAYTADLIGEMMDTQIDLRQNITNESAIFLKNNGQRLTQSDINETTVRTASVPQDSEYLKYGSE